MPNRSKFLTVQNLLAEVGAAACWGISTVMSKGALEFFPPLTLLIVQLLCSNGLLWSIALQQQIPLPPLRAMLLAALSGILLHGLPFWLHTIVLQSLPASFAALFLTLIPLFTIGGAYLFLHEELSLIQWIGAGLILAAMSAIARLEE